MAINPLYIPLFNIEEVILDKDSGLPLAGGVVKFYRDSQRLTPKPVYQIAGTSPNYTFVSLGAVLTLGLSGTFVDQDGDPMVPYAYPYDSEGNLDLYYVTVESEGGVPQFVRQAVPHVDTGDIPPSERINTENELSNPQFVEVNFIEDEIAVINVTGSDTVTAIAPGWDVVTTGTGTLTLERLQPTSANVVTNPPYALRILASAGLGSTFQLRQRLLNTPTIFRNGFASASITAAVLSGGGSFISMDYIPSSGTPTQIIPSTSIPTDGAYHVIANNAAIPDQGNIAADTGYVDISITLPTARNLAITSIQVVGTAVSVNIPFDEQTAARQRDHLAHYYKPQLAYKPIPSFLVGWDFPLNPAQFGSTVGPIATGANKSFYAWDQTIVFQSTTNGIQVSRGTRGQLVLTAQATTQTAIIQYLDGNEIYHILNDKLAVNVAAIAQNVDTAATISLWYTKDVSLPSTVGSANSLVAGLDANGKPNAWNGTWIEIPRELGQDATFTLEGVTSLNEFNDYNFSGWRIADPSDLINATFFAIVVGTASIDSPNLVAFESVSLNSGDIATRPAPQQLSQVLQECQYYYEKSYNVDVKEGTVSSPGQHCLSTFLYESGGNQGYYLKTFEIIFNTKKRVNPVMRFYSPNATTVNRILIEIFLPGTGAVTNSLINTSTTYSSSTSGLGGITMLANSAVQQLSTATNPAHEGLLFYQYVADSRLGL